jgi:hypothetical protein
VNSESHTLVVELDDGDEVEAPREDVREWEETSRWRLIELRNQSPSDGFSLELMVLLERLDLGVEGVLPQVWCRGLAEEHEWVRVPVAHENDRLRLDFPTSEFEQMPGRLFLERPKQPSSGARWRLLDEGGVHPIAALQMRRTENMAGRDVRRVMRFYSTGRVQRSS